jgi:hypothetical protein
VRPELTEKVNRKTLANNRQLPFLGAIREGNIAQGKNVPRDFERPMNCSEILIGYDALSGTIFQFRADKLMRRRRRRT